MTTGILVVQGPNVAWGVDVALISAIVAEAEWFGPVPIDVGEWVGMPPSWSPEPRRILVVRTQDGEIAVRAGGVLIIRDVAPDSIHALPELVLDRSGPRVLAGVVLGEREQPLLLVDADGLRRRAHAAPVERTNGGP